MKTHIYFEITRRTPSRTRSSYLSVCLVCGPTEVLQPVGQLFRPVFHFPPRFIWYTTNFQMLSIAGASGDHWATNKHNAYCVLEWLLFGLKLCIFVVHVSDLGDEGLFFHIGGFVGVGKMHELMRGGCGEWRLWGDEDSLLNGVHVKICYINDCVVVRI